MVTKEILQGEAIFESGQKIDALYLIIKGSVSVSHPGGRHVLHSGDVAGVGEIDCDEAYMEYRAEEKTATIAYPFHKEKFYQIFEESRDSVRYFQSSSLRQFSAVMGQYKLLKVESASLYDYVVSSYEDYERLCEEYHISPGLPTGYEELAGLALEEDVPSWIEGYYNALELMMAAWDSDKTNNDFVCGFLFRASQDIHHLVLLCRQIQEYKEDVCKILMNEKGLDLLELLLSLYGKAILKDGLEGDKVSAIRRTVNDILMQLESQGLGNTDTYLKRKENVEKRLFELESRCTRTDSDTDTENKEDELINTQLKGSLDKILSYAECEGKLEASFRKNIEKYKNTINKNGTEDKERELRRQITKEFYQVYTAAFMKSIHDKEIPKVVKMLFHFGYVDEELAGMQNAVYLYQIADQLPTSPKEGVYSFYEWLIAVYEGRKEPCRNEFDLDYAAYLHEEKRMGNISKEQEKELLKDAAGKVKYELENVFPSVNKMTFGRISTFCPVFSEHNVMKDLSTTLVSKDMVKKILNGIREKDYKAYYRETLFTNPEQGVVKEFINVEVLPDIILMPNVGTRGAMWQEIEGKRRNTPARMMSSIFQMEDMALIMIRLTGEFRWEMCKRIQGGRWNDVSERSLTSEYFDYIQFYRKNPDLSPDAKDKIRTDMGRAKNSFKEMFIMDYVLWVLYESNGAPRLNKVARNIMLTYCTFPLNIREKLKANPMYRELLERYDFHMEQKRHRMDNLCQKLTASGKSIPGEIEKEKQFLYL